MVKADVAGHQRDDEKCSVRERIVRIGKRILNAFTDYEKKDEVESRRVAKRLLAGNPEDNPKKDIDGYCA